MSHKSYLASCAMGALCKTALLAGRGKGSIGYLLMSEGINVVILIGISALAGICGISLFLAGR